MHLVVPEDKPEWPYRDDGSIVPSDTVVMRAREIMMVVFVLSEVGGRGSRVLWWRLESQDGPKRSSSSVPE